MDGDQTGCFQIIQIEVIIITISYESGFQQERDSG